MWERFPFHRAIVRPGRVARANSYYRTVEPVAHAFLECCYDLGHDAAGATGGVEGQNPGWFFEPKPSACRSRWG